MKRITLLMIVICSISTLLFAQIDTSVRKVQFYFLSNHLKINAYHQSKCLRIPFDYCGLKNDSSYSIELLVRFRKPYKIMTNNWADSLVILDINPIRNEVVRPKKLSTNYKGCWCYYKLSCNISEVQGLGLIAILNGNFKFIDFLNQSGNIPQGDLVFSGQQLKIEEFRLLKNK